MLNDKRLEDYINSLFPSDNDFLYDLEQQAHSNYVPVIRKDVQNVLKYLLRVHRPARILEVGTAIGYSAVFMAAYNPVKCEIITIENYEKRIKEARNNIKASGYDDVITLLSGDAQDVLKTLSGGFDFVFMDAAKGQYPIFLPDVMRLLKIGGILVSDNTLQNGYVKESRYAMGRRDRTIHSRMRDYLYDITHRKDMTSIILPIGDGLSISIKEDINEKA